MNRFKSHKIVTAARIVGLEYSKAMLGAMVLEGHATAVPMPRQWYEKHRPEVGGFLMQSEDGYSSYSPATAFEEGYHLIDDGKRHPVWPLRTSCEPEPLEQAQPVLAIEGKFSAEDLAAFDAVMKRETRRPLQLVAVPAPTVPGLMVITEVADSLPEGADCTVLTLDSDPWTRYIVRRQWFEDYKPQVGGGIVPRDGDTPLYYAPGSFTPALPKRVTKAALEAMFRSVTYEIRPDGRTTVCEITFKNGFSLRDESSCAVIDAFDQARGEAGAYSRAIDKAYAFAAFLLLEDRHRAGAA